MITKKQGPNGRIYCNEEAVPAYNKLHHNLIFTLQKSAAFPNYKHASSKQQRILE